MKRALVALLALWAAPAAAQEADRDWDMVRDPQARSVLAHTAFDTGLAITMRCVDGSYQAILSGLPAPAPNARTRVIGISFGDDEIALRSWNVAVAETIAVGPTPARFARKLRKGGRLQIVIPDGGGAGRNLRYDLTLPTSSSSIDETLTACGKPLEDPRDALLDDLGDDGMPGGFTWARMPRPEFPSGSRYATGFAVVTCITNPDGALSDCVVETEHPHDGGFGAATLRATRRARAQSVAAPDARLPAAMVEFRANFFLPGYETREQRERARNQPPAPFQRGDSNRGIE